MHSSVQVETTCKDCGAKFSYMSWRRPRVRCDECKAPKGNGVIEHVCACGKTFTGRWDTKFCSGSCKTKYSGRVERQCEVCGISFRRRPRQDDSLRACSRECGWKLKRKHPYPFTEIAFSSCVHCREICIVAQQRKWCANPACAKRADRIAERIRNERNCETEEAKCPECGTVFVSQYGDKRKIFCSLVCGLKQQRRTTKAVRRARERTDQAESINPFKVFERDGWRCCGCGVSTPKSLRGTLHAHAPEVDHIVPLSRGGPHSWVNLQTLCRSCNQSKRDRLDWKRSASVQMKLAYY